MDPTLEGIAKWLKEAEAQLESARAILRIINEQIAQLKTRPEQTPGTGKTQGRPRISEAQEGNPTSLTSGTNEQKNPKPQCDTANPATNAWDKQQRHETDEVSDILQQIWEEVMTREVSKNEHLPDILDEPNNKKARTL